MDHEAVIRACFDCYRRKDRETLEGLLAEDFTFTSLYRDAIDRSEYFERCWPNADRITEHVIEKIVAADGDAAYVTYLAKVADGSDFRNTEYFTFRGPQIKSVDVYFEAKCHNGKFVEQHRA